MANIANKNKWTLLLVLLCGVVLGGFIGQLCSGVSWLSWLSYGRVFGLTSPVVLDLGIIVLTFGITITINIASIIGIIVGIIIYKVL
jgi:hypothetical protein